MFGHSALVSEVQSLVDADFPVPGTRPRGIIGISLVTQARLRYGGQGGQVCLASRIDVWTGRTTARVGWFDQAMQWTPDWVPFFEAMKQIASFSGAALGATIDVQRRSYQSFVTEIVDSAVAAGDQPVVMLDSTSASGLWPWLTDAKIDGPPVIGPENMDKSSDWASARLVRIRTKRAGRVFERATVRYETYDQTRMAFAGETIRYCPTVVAKTIELPRAKPGRARHYWVTGGYLEQSPRGLSVYRVFNTFVPADKVRGLGVPVPESANTVVTGLALDISDEPYRLPNAIDVTVALLAPGDDPASIAHLVASLRCGYGHSRLDTTLPAPLFFETKARDYMARFTIDELDAEDDEAALPTSEPVPDLEDEAEPVTAEEEGMLDAVEAEDSVLVVLDPATGTGEGIAQTLRMPESPTFPVTLTLLPPWSRLLRPSLAVTLVDSTSLSTPARVLGANIAPGARRFEIPDFLSGMRDPASRNAVVRTGAVAKATEASVQGQDVNKPGWLEVARTAVVPVPSFVDAGWVRGVTSLPSNNQILKDVQRHRAIIGKVSGYEWPEQRPFGGEADEAIVRGLERPLAFRVIMDVAYLSLEKNKQRKFHPFSILNNRLHAYRWESEIGTAAHRNAKRKEARKSVEVVRLLADNGHRQDALSLAYLEVLSKGWTKAMADAVRTCGLDELSAFMGVMAEHGPAPDMQKDVFAAVWMAMHHRKPGGGDLPPKEVDEAGSASDISDEDGDATSLTRDSTDEPGGRPTVTERAGETSAGSPEPDIELIQDEHLDAVTAPTTGELHADMPGPIVAKPHVTEAVSLAGDPAASALAAWHSAMALLARAATEAGQGEPAAETLWAAIPPLRQARAAFRAWQAAQPRRVDAAPLVLRGQLVIAGLATLPKPLAFSMSGGLETLSGSVMVDPDIFDEATSLIAEAEANLSEAQEAHARVLFIKADDARLFAMWGDLSASKTAMEGAIQTSAMRLDAAGAILTAGVQNAAPPAELDTRASPAAAAEAADGGSAPRVDETAACATVAAAVTDFGGGQPADERPDDTAQDQPDDPGLEMIEETEAADAAGPGPVEPVMPEKGLVGDGDLLPALGSEGSQTMAQVQDAEPEMSAEATEFDPMKAAVADKLTDLVAAQAFGAAYQLRRAAGAVFPAMESVPFSAAELRLAAMVGHIGHVAMQGSTLLERVVQAAITAVNESTDNSEATVSRRIILSAACAELAVFHPSLPAAFGTAAIEETTAELNEAFRDLRAAVTDSARFGSITPALLRTVSEEMADDRYVETCRQAVLDNIVAFSKMHFNWAPANRIRANLHMRNGVIGEYQARIAASDVEAARAFTAEYRDRGKVMTLAERIDVSLTVKPKPLDGAARERLLSAFDELSALSAEYVDAADALSAARTSRHKMAVQRIAQSVSSGAEMAIHALEAFSVKAGRLSAAACAFAISALTRLKDAADGRFVAVGIHDHQLAVHGPLLWLPGLHYGSSWLPSPYRPEGIVNTMLDLPAPATPELPGNDAFDNAVRARVAEGSFIAARLLIQACAFYGVDDGTRAQMADHCDANLQTWRTNLKDSLDDTRRMIDKVQRMGSLVRVDQASAIFAVLDRITPDTLPAEVSLEARTEEVEPEQILDFGSARDQIQDVRDRVNGLLEEPRKALLTRLQALGGTVRAADVDRVRGLIASSDDLVTAGEYVGFLEEGGALPERASGNRRYHAFFPAVPDTLAKLGKGSLDEVKRAIETGTDLPGLPYSHIPAASRAEAVERLEVWSDLRRRVERGDQAQAVQPLLDRLFTAARMSPVVLSPATNGPKLPPKTYVAEIRLSLPEDKASLLLPDFGSLVGFSYRIAIAPKLPSDGEMAALCRDAGTFGTMVVVTSVIGSERRVQLQRSCLEHNRRVLVLDEAVLLYALSEAEFRPLTLIECTQPFSFAAPYKDYGNSPVPPEMFFGRETEIRKIVDRMGSCIVYGGRRLGKTALLRHIRAQHSDTEEGGSTAVGYANIRDGGAAQNPIWEAASRDLTAIFRTPVRTGAEFRTRIGKWLEEDSKRRVLLLLDEADQFIEGDSKQQFTEFSELQRLMDNSFRRFKVVLAGLHNVTRIVRTENSPLKQIASDPQRIGPLMDKELPDAERLVTRPLAALGYEFKNRSDVWRILSHCNYYPVLVQTFCAGLLSSLMEATVRRTRGGTGEITDRQVRDAIENEDIRREIEEKFAYTIREIDPRYELITCIVAEQVLRDTQSGRADEGMTAVQVLDGAATWWPVAFEHPNSLETVKDLLDEMVGLGVLRQTPSGAWALRSHAILRLLGDENHVTSSLLSFEKRPAPPAFDPRSMRKSLSLPKEDSNYPCPLTWGQEHDLGTGTSALSVVFGSTLADVGYVGEALRGAEALSPDGVKKAVVVRYFTDLASFTATLRTLARVGAPTLLVVDIRTQWDFAWLEVASKQGAVKDGTIRIVFVGGAEHALRWACNPRKAKLPGVQTVSLQPWADAYLGHKLGEGNLPPDRFARDIRRITGGYNRLMSWVFIGFSGHNHDRFAKHLEKIEGRIAKIPDLLAEAGLTASMGDLFGRLAEWADGNGRIGTDEIRICAEEAPGGLAITGAQTIHFGVSMGLLEPVASRPGEDPEHRAYAIAPSVLAALKHRQAQLEVA